jgi:glycosyltransferase involved in cell wall biosynthesis
MIKNLRFSTSLRQYTRRTIEQISNADILIGIPAYYSAPTINYIIKTVAKGLDKYYGDYKSVILISDGGSTDDTRDNAESVNLAGYNVHKIVHIYRGVPGKGSALRSVFEASEFLRAKAVAVVDSDLKSITPEWISNLISPVLEGYDLVSPDYKRFKYDATITNTIAYNLTRALYGYNIRQPIGGDYGLSLNLIKHFLDQDVWHTQVAKFGIDIWMTTTAIVSGFKICQTKLGAKIHEEKEPSDDLTPMYREVVGTIFTLMEQHEDYWKKTKGLKEVPSFGQHDGPEPTPFTINRKALIEYFRLGYNNFSGVWKKIIGANNYKTIEELMHTKENDNFHFPIDSWVKIVYKYAKAFQSTPRQKFKLLNTMIPLYNAQVASLVNDLKDKTYDEANEHFEKDSRVFENMKDYLLKIW